MTKKLCDKDELEIIQKYKSGLSMSKLGKEYEINPATVLRVLQRHNIETRTKGGIYKLPECQIIDLYLSGKSSSFIAKQFNVTEHTITNLLEKNNIERNNRYKNCDLDVEYFSKINSSDKAYFLGFLITDGNVSLKSNCVSLSLSAIDIDILKTMAKKTHNSNNIYHYQKGTRDEVTLSAKCAKWKEDLKKYGVIPQKTNSVFIPQLEDFLMPHLLRGMIDGDGWISSKSPQIGFCGNEITTCQMRDFFVKHLNVFPVKMLKTEPHLFQIAWSGKNDILKIGSYIYQDKQDCFLSRKYNNFLEIQGNIEVNK